MSTLNAQNMPKVTAQTCPKVDPIMKIDPTTRGLRLPHRSDMKVPKKIATTPPIDWAAPKNPKLDPVGYPKSERGKVKQVSTTTKPMDDSE